MMRLGLGLGITRGGGVAGFDPLSLFAGGEEGVLFDKLNPADGFLFQDSGLTTLCAAAGDPVGGMLDRSGNGNTALQSTNNDFRPTVEQDGSGNWYLDFDGVDDALFTSSIDFTSTDEMTIIVAVRKDSDVAVSLFMELSVNAGASNGSFFVTAPGTVSPNGNYGLGVRGTSTPLELKTSTVFAAPVTSLVTLTADISTPSREIRVDGVSDATSALTMGTGNFGNHPLFLGARAGTSLHFDGRFYGSTVINRTLTAQELADNETYFGNLAGLSI